MNDKMTNKQILFAAVILSSLTLWYVLVLWSTEPTVMYFKNLTVKVYRNVFLYIVPTISQILVMLILLWHLWRNKKVEK